MSTRMLIVSALLTLPACSAIVQPDSRRLGPATDSAGLDAGPPIDTFRIAPDAYVEPGTDTGSLACASDCNDGRACTADLCVMGVCSNTPTDGDGDGQLALECMGTDCNDANMAVFRGAPEVCGDTIDNNCDGAPDEGCAAPDNCAAARAVAFVERHATITGDSTRLSADYDTGCLTRALRDAVFRVEIPDGSDLRIETSGTIDVALAASMTCGNFSGAACNDDRNSPDRNARIWIHNAPGVWYVLLSSFDPGPFSVDFDLLRSTDECGGSNLDVSAGGTVIGVTTEMRATATCMPDRSGALRESVFLLNATTFDDITVNANFRPYLSIRTSCDLADEEDCEAGAASTGTLPFRTSLAPGRYASPMHIFVDGGAMRVGNYALQVNP